MSVSISQLVKKTKDFQEQQLKKFKQFVNISKELKSAIASQKEQAGKDWQDMEGMLDELKTHQPPNNKDPMEVLAEDPLYAKWLNTERILEPGFNKPKETKDFMKTRQDEINKYLEQRNKENE